MKVAELRKILEKEDPETLVYVEEEDLVYGLGKHKVQHRAVDGIEGLYISLIYKPYRE